MPQRVIALSTRLRDLTVRIMRSRWFRVALGLFGWWAVALGVMLLGQARITYVLQETTHDVSGRASGLCCQGYYGLIPGIRSWVTQCILLTLGGALFISAGLWYRWLAGHWQPKAAGPVTRKQILRVLRTAAIAVICLVAAFCGFMYGRTKLALHLYDSCLDAGDEQGADHALHAIGPSRFDMGTAGRYVLDATKDWRRSRVLSSIYFDDWRARPIAKKLLTFPDEQSRLIGAFALFHHGDDTPEAAAVLRQHIATAPLTTPRVIPAASLLARNGDTEAVRFLIHTFETAPPPFDVRAIVKLDHILPEFMDMSSDEIRADRDRILRDLRAWLQRGTTQREPQSNTPQDRTPTP